MFKFKEPPILDHRAVMTGGGAGVSGLSSPNIIKTLYLSEKGEVTNKWNGLPLELDRTIEELTDMLCKMAFSNRMKIFQEEKKQKLCKLIKKVLKS